MERPQAECLTQLRLLAGQQLNPDQLTSLATRIKRLRTAPAPLPDLTPFKLGILSNSSTEILASCLEATALRYGFNLEVTTTAFGLSVAEALNPASILKLTHQDAILIALDGQGLGLSSLDARRSPPPARLELAQQMIESIKGGFQNNGPGVFIFQTLPIEQDPLLGNMDLTAPMTTRHVIKCFNQWLVETARGPADLILDVERLAATVGWQNWYNPVQWHLARFAFAQHWLPLYADHLLRLLAALRGKSRKCLVLDLDNTLWGGIIGDDGLDGITIGQGDPLGEAFLSVQRAALTLHDRGIILAVCSKNEEANARIPFQKHPDMLLKEDHFALFVANWQNKATNIETIAHDLNIGLDALVFLDDNPMERDQVRTTLNTVAVPELPDDPAFFAATLMNAGYFETLHITDDDRERTRQYRANAERTQQKKQHTDLDGYLASLEMSLRLSRFDEAGLARITQLINKTNQFNLTTRRYTEDQVKAMIADPTVIGIQARLVDRLGDNGMISIVIIRQYPKIWDIDTWLMSCRVFNRRVEEAVFQEIVRLATTTGNVTLTGNFIPSGRNTLVQDLYKNLGFVKLSEGADGSSRWHFSPTAWNPKPLPMAIDSRL